MDDSLGRLTLALIATCVLCMAGLFLDRRNKRAALRDVLATYRPQRIQLLRNVHGLSASVWYEFNGNMARELFIGPSALMETVELLSLDHALGLLCKALYGLEAGPCFGEAYDRLANADQEAALVKTLDTELKQVLDHDYPGLFTRVSYSLLRLPD